MLLIYSIAALISGILSIGFAFLVYFRNKKGLQNKLFGLLSLSIAIWTFSYWIWLNLSGDNYSIALFWSRMLNLGATLIPVLYVHWIFSILQIHHKKKNLIIYGYLATAFFILFSFSPWYIKEVKPVFFFPFWPQAGIIFTLYIILHYFFYNAVAFYFLIKDYRISNGSKKNQLKYLILGSLFGFGGGAFNFPLMYSVEIIHPIGMFFVPFNTILFAYASIKYRLMNIRLVLTRSILYAVLVATVASFFALSVVVVGNSIGGNTQASKIITYIITSFIVVVFLDPVKRTWAKVTDKIFYKDKIDYQEVLREMGNVLAKEINLNKLLKGSSQLLAEKLKIKRVTFFMANAKGEFYFLTTSEKKEQDFKLSDNFVRYIKRYKKILITDELIRDLGDLDEKSDEYKALDSFIKESEKKCIEMIMPVVENENLTAILIFDAKQSGDLYGQDDINFLEVFVPQMATAIEKSKLYKEVEDFNRELQQKVDDRTKSLKEVNIALEDRNKFLTTIQVVTNMISHTLDLKKVNQMIADSISTELGYVAGMLTFAESGKKYLQVGAITNNEHTQKAFKILSKEPKNYRTKLVKNYNLSAQTFLTGKINFSDKLSDFLSPPVDKIEVDKIQQALGIKTIVGVPVFSEAKIIGVIQYYLPIERAKISSLDIEIMTALTNHVGIVSRNLKLYNNLQDANTELQDANLRLRELDKAKSEFLSIASHQLRTPISAIKGYLSMMIDGDFGPLPKKINDVIKNLFESSARLARLINIFLNVSRIESGRLKLDKKPIQIDEMIDSVIIELINQAKQKGVKLEYKKKKKASPLILADEDKLREVVLNLVDNAIKYTPEGSIMVTVEFDKKELNFKVTDTGIGIKKDEVKTLFRKFVRGSGVAQIHTGGSGLGLFIAQKIIKEHNGQVWAESEGSGKGSVFQFTIPVYDDKQAPNYKKEAEEK